jgi:sporulation protein YlmC with PRC-barrel domain
MTGVSILRASAVLLAGWLLACDAQAAPVSASGLLGARVTSLQGERLGEIRDLAVDVASGTVSYAILEAAATSRLDAQLSAVPLTALQPGLARDELRVNAAADAPWRARLPEGEVGSHVMRARVILGMAIEHPSGADYGVIHDLVLELNSGRVLHAQVALDAARDGVKREVPLGALRFPPAESHAILTLAQGGDDWPTRRASAMLGAPAVDRHGKMLGVRAELIVEPLAGAVHYAVVRSDGWLWLPERQYLYPTTALARGAQGTVAVQVDREDLVRASDLFGSRLVDERGAALGEVEDLVFDARNGALRSVVVDGVALPISRLRPEAGGERYVLRRTEDGRAAAVAEPKWPAMRASLLINHEVVDRLHRDFGEIRDVVVNLDARQVRSVIIDRADDWQPGRALLTVAIEELSLPRDLGDKVALNYSRERFE